MQQRDPRVDRSRGAVYQAEDSLASIMRRTHRAVRVGRRVVTLPAEVRFAGVDEVQIDYVRFPTNGWRGDWRGDHEATARQRCEVITGFVAMLSGHLDQADYVR